MAKSVKRRMNTWAIIIPIVLVVFGYLMLSGAFGNTRLGISIMTNQSIKNGLIAHYTFDSDLFGKVNTFQTNGYYVRTNSADFDDYARGVTIHNGNMIVTGYCNACGGANSWGIHTFKHTIDSNYIFWATTTNSVQSGFIADYAYDVAHDEAGDVYITGACDECGSRGAFAHYTLRLDGTTSDIIWSTTTDMLAADGDLEIAKKLYHSGSLLYVSGECGACGTRGLRAVYTYAIDPANGNMVWATTTDYSTGDDFVGGITGDGSSLYVTEFCTGCGTETKIRTYKLDGDTGELIWATTTDPTKGTSAVDRSAGGIVYADEGLYVAGSKDDNGRLYTFSVNPINGNMVWATTTSVGQVANSSVVNDMTYGDGVLFIAGVCWSDVGDKCGPYGNSALSVVAIDAETTDFVWATSTNPSSTNSDALYGIAYENETLVAVGRCSTGCASSAAQYIYVIDALTGESAYNTNTIVDQSGNGNDAVSYIFGNPSVPGVTGQGVRTFPIPYKGTTATLVDAENSRIRPTDLEDQLLGDQSYGAWVKVEAGKHTGTAMGCIICRDTVNGGGERGGIVINDLADNADDDNELGFVDITNGVHEIDTEIQIADGDWHHVFYTREGSAGTLYFDGEVAGTHTANATFLATNQLSIGAGHASFGVVLFLYRLEGDLDEVRFYNRAISAAEVRRIYELGATTKINKTLRENEPGLVGHWDFDGSNEEYFEDSSGNGNHLWLTKLALATSTHTVIGKIGQAFEVFGSNGQAAWTDDDATLKPTDAISVAAWIYADLDNPTEGNTVVSMHEYSGPGFQSGYKLGSSFDTPALSWFVDDNLDNGRAINLTYANYFTKHLGEWHHVAGTFEAGVGGYLYLDGELVSSQTSAATIPASIAYFTGREFFVGVRNEGNEYRATNGSGQSYQSQFDGKIDDLRVYNRRITADEVKHLYGLGATTYINKTLSTSESLRNGLIGHWDFDGSFQTEVEDKSGNGNTLYFTTQSAGTSTHIGTGKIGQGVVFPGYNLGHLEGPTFGPIFGTTTSALSVAAWVYPDKGATTEGRMVVATYDFEGVGGTENSGYQFGRTWLGSDAFGFNINDGTGGDTTCNIDNFLANHLGEWRHIVGTWDPGNSIKMYMDGELVRTCSTNIPASIGTSDTPEDIAFGVGARTDNANGASQWDGKIDDVRIYDRVLSAQEVKRLYGLGGE